MSRSEHLLQDEPLDSLWSSFQSQGSPSSSSSHFEDSQEDSSLHFLPDYNSFDLFEDLSSFGVEENLRSDCMWSSTSLCGDGSDKLTGKNSLEYLDDLLLEPDPLLSTSPLYSSISHLLSSNLSEVNNSSSSNSSNHDDDDDEEEKEEEEDEYEDDDEEEIDVVSETERLCRKRKIPSSHHTSNLDHSYHCLQGPLGSSLGILTPTESEDDDSDFRLSSSSFSSPVQDGSNRLSHLLSESVKFKFKMKFNSSSSPSRTKSGSAPYSPSSSSSSSSPSSSLLINKNDSNNHHKNSSGPLGSLRSKTRTKVSDVSKCRQVRDLHNSMERQRRVDLRKNFETLKDSVPELCDVDKASKLNILNKSADYCRHLTDLESSLSKDKESLFRINNSLLKKLSQLTSSSKASAWTPS